EMDATAREVAAENGLECKPHSGTKLTRALCRQADLILVMEQRQKDRISEMAPESSGKTMLLGKWLGDKEVPDPFKRSREVYDQAYVIMDEAVNEWVKRLKKVFVDDAYVKQVDNLIFSRNNMANNDVTSQGSANSDDGIDLLKLL